jgi:hypothetical protein
LKASLEEVGFFILGKPSSIPGTADNSRDHESNHHRCNRNDRQWRPVGVSRSSGYKRGIIRFEEKSRNVAPQVDRTAADILKLSTVAEA